MKASLVNKRFCLKLSALCDIYKVFGHAVNILQTVNMLPYEKYQYFLKCINTYTTMLEKLPAHTTCAEKCLWPTYHHDLNELRTTGKYRGIIIVENYVEERRNNITRFLIRDDNGQQLQQAQVIAQVEKKIARFTRELYNKLKDNVYDESDLKILNVVKCLTDLKSTFLKLKARGVPMVNAIEGEKFIRNAKSLCHSIDDVPDDVLKSQYSIFLKRLLDAYNGMPQADLDNLTNIDIIKRFFNTNQKLYEGIEFVIHAITAASTAISVESIVESVVSIYENRQSKTRTLSEDSSNQEMQIGINGPSLAKSDNVLEKALNNYFKAHKQGKWHFTMDPKRIEYTVSKTVDSKK